MSSILLARHGRALSITLENMRILLKRSFGLLTFLIGVVLCVWFVYNQFWPTEEFKSGFISVFQLFTPIAFIGFGWKWMHYNGKGIEEVIPSDLQFPELDASKAKAEVALPEFIAEVEKGIDDAFIMFKIKASQDLTGPVWAYVHFYKDRRFNVSTIADNMPVAHEQIIEGTRFDVPIEDVEDWLIILPDDSIRGAFSRIALFEYWEKQGKHLSPRMKQQKAQLNQ